jgi:hypothetical protein
LLAENTIYVVPRMNPDAAEAFFAPLRQERKGNETPSDDDRDHALDEDGADDLNRDGMITMMRVRAPGGEWIPDAVDPALMRRADPGKGERGVYRLFTEGRDDDGDEEYNEDGPGGTDISRNFSNNFAFFTPGSGLHPFAATESRAVAEFVSTQANIAAIYVLGMQDNLIKAWEGRRVPGIGGSPQGPTSYRAPESEQPSHGWKKRLARQAPGCAPTALDAACGPRGPRTPRCGRCCFGSYTWPAWKTGASALRCSEPPSSSTLA